MNYADFDRIYEEHSLMVWKIAMKYTGDAFLSEDVCQEVFEKLHKRASDIDPEELGYWLMVVAKNTAIDLMRKMRQGQTESLDASHREVGTMRDDPLRQVVSREHRQEMLNALRKHDPAGYELLMELVFGKNDIKALAAIKNTTPNNLYTKLYRIRKWLKENYPDI